MIVKKFADAYPRRVRGAPATRRTEIWPLKSMIEEATVAVVGPSSR
jgi:hypothetical protein